MPFAEGTPTTDITLGGKSYTLGWTWGAKRRLKEVLASRGKELNDAAAVQENIPAVLWAAMDSESRNALSVEDVEELVNPRNESEVVDKIGLLFKASEPDPEVKQGPVAGKIPTTGRSTLPRSGPLPDSTLDLQAMSSGG